MDTPDQPEPDLQPWVWPYAVRRDCEPHRGELLSRLGLAAFTLSLVGMSMGIPCTMVVGDELFLPGLPSPDRVVVFLALAAPGVLASVVIWWLAARDLAEMSRGRRDPAGEELTGKARSYGRAGVVIAALGMTFWAICTVVILAVKANR